MVRFLQFVWPSLTIVATALCLKTAPGIESARAAPASPGPVSPCRATETSRNLDFLVGEWNVYSGSARIGTDRVERTLDGCALLEHKRDLDGQAEASLFAYDAHRDSWTQTGASGETSRAGAPRVRTLGAHAPRAMVFQSEAGTGSAKSGYDRRIIASAQDRNTVRLIDQASADGVSWATTSDLIYRRRSAPRRAIMFPE